MITVVERGIGLSDQAEDRYPRIPFDVPEGAESFEVRLEVDGEAVVDLGCEDPSGWRGWSGGARDSFVITRDDATPGYLPGNLLPGRWHVVVGLHSLPAGDAGLRVTVETPSPRPPDHGPVEEPARRETRGSDRELPAPAGLRWYAGDTHAHSLHSDGALSLWELANEGVRSGLDFLCVTDHNTTSHHAHLPRVGLRQGITLVPSQEVTTHRGHANAFGEIGFVDFRRPATEWVTAVADRGGLLSINHPVSGDCSWLHPLGEAPWGVELYHSDWYREPASTSALAWYVGRDTAVIGGGDFHNRTTPLRPGLPTTWLLAEENSPGALLEAMAAGRTTITADAELIDGVARPRLLDAPILVRDGERLRALSAVGLVLVGGDGRRLVIGAPGQAIAAPRDAGPYRLEDARRRVLALSR